jgi:hypothetical protein
MAHTGRCLCGAIRYELSGELGPLVNCHCQFCRRAHGAAFATVSWVPSAALCITAGESIIREYHPEGVGSRCFCERCGTRLWNRSLSTPTHLSLVIASLDGDPPRGPVMHINTESKAGWYQILDALPQYAALPPMAKRALEE